jgi:hypothetical protein
MMTSLLPTQQGVEREGKGKGKALARKERRGDNGQNGGVHYKVSKTENKTGKKTARVCTKQAPVNVKMEDGDE